MTITDYSKLEQRIRQLEEKLFLDEGTLKTQKFPFNKNPAVPHVIDFVEKDEGLEELPTSNTVCIADLMDKYKISLRWADTEKFWVATTQPKRSMETVSAWPFSGMYYTEKYKYYLLTQGDTPISAVTAMVKAIEASK